MGVRLEGKNNKFNAAGSSANASILTQQGVSGQAAMRRCELGGEKWCSRMVSSYIDCCCTLDTYVSVNNLPRFVGEKKEENLPITTVDGRQRRRTHACSHRRSTMPRFQHRA